MSEVYVVRECRGHWHIGLSGDGGTDLAIRGDAGQDKFSTREVAQMVADAMNGAREAAFFERESAEWQRLAARAHDAWARENPY